MHATLGTMPIPRPLSSWQVSRRTRITAAAQSFFRIFPQLVSSPPTTLSSRMPPCSCKLLLLHCLCAWSVALLCTAAATDTMPSQEPSQPSLRGEGGDAGAAGSSGSGPLLMGASGAGDGTMAASAATSIPPVRLLVVRVGILDRNGRPGFAPQCDEATLKVGVVGGPGGWGVCDTCVPTSISCQ